MEEQKIETRYVLAMNMNDDEWDVNVETSQYNEEHDQVREFVEDAIAQGKVYSDENPAIWAIMDDEQMGKVIAFCYGGEYFPMQESKTQKLDVDDWWDEYQPIETKDGTLLEIKRHHRELIRELHHKRLIWTEYDNGEIWPGVFFVNRLRYLVCRKPYRNTDIVVDFYDDEPAHYWSCEALVIDDDYQLHRIDIELPDMDAEFVPQAVKDYILDAYPDGLDGNDIMDVALGGYSREEVEETEDLLDQLADEAHAEYLAGETEEFDPDKEEDVDAE